MLIAYAKVTFATRKIFGWLYLVVVLHPRAKSLSWLRDFFSLFSSTIAHEGFSARKQIWDSYVVERVTGLGSSWNDDGQWFPFHYKFKLTHFARPRWLLQYLFIALDVCFNRIEPIGRTGCSYSTFIMLIWRLSTKMVRPASASGYRSCLC